MGDRRMMGQGMRRRMGAPMNTLAMAEDHDDNEPQQCEYCGGPVNPMGSLGRKQYGRCRNCGMDQEIQGGG